MPMHIHYIHNSQRECLDNPACIFSSVVFIPLTLVHVSSPRSLWFTARNLIGKRIAGFDYAVYQHSVANPPVLGLFYFCAVTARLFVLCGHRTQLHHTAVKCCYLHEYVCLDSNSMQLWSAVSVFKLYFMHWALKQSFDTQHEHIECGEEKLNNNYNKKLTRLWHLAAFCCFQFARTKVPQSEVLICSISLSAPRPKE